MAVMFALLCASGCVDDVDPDLSEMIQEEGGGSGSGGYGAGNAACPCTNPPYNCPNPLPCTTSCIGTGYAETKYTWTLAGTNYPVYSLGNQVTVALSSVSELRAVLDALLHTVVGWHVGLGVIREQGAIAYDEYGGWKNRPQWYNGDQLYGYPSRSIGAGTANHGRTINTDGLRSATVNHEMTNASSISAFVFRAPGGANDGPRLGAIEWCVGVAMTDGFCDRNCGNDAYTAPPALHLGPEDGSAWFALFSARAVYSGDGWAAWDNAKAGSGTYWIPFAVPEFGHNSNTDALAEAAMFGRCGQLAAQIQGSCAVPSVGPTIANHVKEVCTSVCGMYRSSSSTRPGTDSNLATVDSGLGKKVGSWVFGGGWGQPTAGHYTSGSWGYQVDGM